MQAGYDYKQPLFVVGSCFHFPSFTVPFWKVTTACGQQLFLFPIFHCVSFRKSNFASSHQYFPFHIFDCCLFGNSFDEGVSNHFLQQYCKYRHQFIVSLSAVLELFQPPLMIMIHSVAADATIGDLQQPNSNVEKYRYACIYRHFEAKILCMVIKDSRLKKCC